MPALFAAAWAVAAAQPAAGEAAGSAAGETAGEGFSFLALGDTPYYPGDRAKLKKILAAGERERFDFIVHVGDIKAAAAPCSDGALRKMSDLFRRQPRPVVYTPGDNEWTDCHRDKAGGHDPLERLAFLRRTFFDDPAVLRLSRLDPVVQAGGYPENYRFSRGGLVFATLHVVGSNNNRRPEDAAALQEYEARDRASREFMHEAFSQAAETGARGLVLIFHADPKFEGGGFAAASGFKGFLTDLVGCLRGFDRPVLAIHGDSHKFKFDRPLKDPKTRKVIPHFQRLEVYGAKTVRGVAVTVGAGHAGGELFTVADFPPGAGAKEEGAKE